jgi:MtaA/CmuA family methyltransferase
MTSAERIRAVVRGEQPDRLPNVAISMMVAADEINVPYGRYATDWREHVRGQIAFAQRYAIDHVSAISDPAIEAADCGAAVCYPDDAPPALDENTSLLTDKTKLAALRAPDPGEGRRMSNRLRVIEELRAQVGDATIVEGWVEGPIAEASDLRGINRFMLDFYDDPQFVSDVLAFIFEMEMAFAQAQVDVGADVIGIGDAAASLIGGALYEEFALPYHIRYVERIHAMGAMVRLHICGDSRFVLPHLPKIRPDIMDLDSMAPVADARRHGGPEQVLTGNIDPVRVLRDATPDSIKRALGDCFTAAAGRSYMVAAGCEIARGTPEANILAMAEFAQNR